MAEFDTFESEAIATGIVGLPPQPAELPEIKLFGRWSCDDVQVNDMSLHVSVFYTNFKVYFIIIIAPFRTILLLKKRMPSIYHTRLDVMRQSVLEKHNAQLLNV